MQIMQAMQTMQAMQQNIVRATSCVLYLRRATAWSLPVAFLHHTHLEAWVNDCAQLCQPNAIYVCDGTKEEASRLSENLVQKGLFVRLNASRWPNSYHARMAPTDVSRSESRTFTCSTSPHDAGPTNQWRPPSLMRSTLRDLFHGSMRGRTMFVIPYCMGPLESPMARMGVQITDSPYVVIGMRILTRMGTLDSLKRARDFIPGLHSVGRPLRQGENDNTLLPCNSDHKYIVHFPNEQELYSFGSSYGSNAFLGKTCMGKRLASCLGRSEGWTVGHMVLFKVVSPDNRHKYMAAAFPSSCGKTNLAMLSSTIGGWHVETLGDDLVWIKPDQEGRLRAMNPEAGIFGVVPGTSMQSNPNAMQTISRNTIFTNVGITKQGDAWWEGISETVPPNLTNWLGESHIHNSETRVAHPNARFCAPLSQCPSLASEWNALDGVPLDAIIVGGRRSTTLPLVMEAHSWQHGVSWGSALRSETTAALDARVGEVRNDPFSMGSFCGFHMGDYLAHWLTMGEQTPDPSLLPRFFHVNWFRKGRDGQFLWPGFGENIRVLKWIFERCDGEGSAEDSPIGLIPTRDALDTHGLDGVSMHELLAIHPDDWMDEVRQIRAFYETLGPKVPKALYGELTDMERRLRTQIPL